jgi:tetratricopeptide (TPR) repeat protein
VTDLGDAVARVAELVALCIVPPWLSPEPRPAGTTGGLLAAVALVALLAAAAMLKPKAASRLGRWAAALWWVAVAAATAGALVCSGPRAPLGRAVPFVAPFVWAALAVTAAAVAERRLRGRVPRPALAAAAVVVVLGAASVGSAAPLLRSRERMWQAALAQDPANETAVLHAVDALTQHRKHADALAVAEKCIAAEPAVCVCHALRARAEIRQRRPDVGMQHAQAAVDLCPASPMAIAAKAEALVMSGAAAPGLAEAARGLELVAGHPDGAAAWLHYVHALALESADGGSKRDEARRELDQAIELGAGRDAKLAAANMAFAANDLDGAQRWSEAMLADDAKDIDAIYNRALVAHKRDDYNHAREGYLATLKLEPDYAVARFNLAVLTWKRGAREEAKNHVRKFIERFPDDARGAELVAMVGGLAP